MNLGEISPPAPLPAAIADRAAPGNALSRYVVSAMPMGCESLALATIPLRTRGAHANLVGLAGLAAARNQPTPAALVAGENLVGVELEESEPAKVVGGKRLRL